MGGLRSVAVLGSTGSIGRQTLDVIARSDGRFRVRSLAAHTDAEGVCDQAEACGAERVVLVDADAAARARERLPNVEVLDGAGALEELAADPGADVVLNAVVGAAGLRATLTALDAGRHVALANKESCVAGGPLVRRRLVEGGGTLVPVDSEHASTHMCLLGEDPAGVGTLVLTASGGPFRGRTRDELTQVTVDDALAHPTWRMGAKITVDSATLANKGLEVIEAHVLFGFAYDAIEVVVHPQSIVHCLVGFADGSWKAALGPPDMRVPIAYALGYPERPGWGAEPVSWERMRELTFEPPDPDAFPMLRLAYDAGRAGGTAPAVLNAANEAAVQGFLDGRVAFLEIAEVVERVLGTGADADLGYGRDDVTLDDVLSADAWAREQARR